MRRAGGTIAAAFLGLAAGLAAVAVGPSGAVSAAPPEPTRIALGTIAPEGSPWADQILEIKQRIEKESGGRLKVAVFFGGRKGSEVEMLTDLRRGRLQAAAVSNGVVATVVPECGVLEVPFFYRDAAEIDYVIDEVIGKDLAAKMGEKGLLLNLWAENGWRSIGTRTKPVRTPEDAKDLRVRAQESQINLTFWSALGAKPTPIPLTEVLPALETGVIQGFDQTPVYMAAAGWHTQVRYYTLTEHMYQPACLVLNKRFVESLSEDLQAIIRGDGHAEALKNRRQVRKWADDLLKELAEQKIEIIRLTDAEKQAFREKIEPKYDDIRKVVGPAIFDKVKAALEEYRAKGRN